MTYGERQEEKVLFGHKETSDNRAKHLFNALASAGANNEKLARLLVAWDFAMFLLQWDTSLTDIVVNYQASIDAKYHDDYKAVATIEELDRRMAARRSLGRQDLQQQGGLNA